MASYHCTVKVGGKGKAAPHAAYISRTGKYRGSDRYEDLEATACGNMPPWAESNPAHFWEAADKHERANGATYREIEVALPRELGPAQRRALVADFVQQELGGRHAYQWAIHTPKAALEQGQQPHAHIMYSERTRDGIERDPAQLFKRFNAKAPEKGGCRKDSAGTEERLQATRQRWADVQNAHLARHGQAARVDHRSLKAQGIDRAPEKHLGGAGVRQLVQGDILALLARRAAEGAHERAQQSVASLIDLSGDLSAARADRDRRQQAAERAADKPAGIDPRSYFHPDNIARRAAQVGVPAKPALLATAERFEQVQAEKRRMSAPRPSIDTGRNTPETRLELTQQEEKTLALQAASAKKAQWEAALKAERALYLAELTAQAHAKAVAGVARHQAHLDAKPMLFGRDQWEAQRQGFESRDAANKLAWRQLKDGVYPFVSDDQEAVQQAVERRVSDKNPALARDILQANAALQAERERVAALERDQQAQARAERAKAYALDQALSAFKRHALKREMKSFGYGDTGRQWAAMPEAMRAAIEDFNRLPKEARPIVLARMGEKMQRDPQGVEAFTQGLASAETERKGMSR